MNKPETSASTPWTHVYGLARSLVALGTLGTLAFNHSSVLWHTVSGMPEAPVCSDLAAKTSLFCMLPDHLELARWIAVALLAWVVSGYLPRVSGLIHLWITHSFVSTALVIDGGDHLSATLSMLLLPLTLTDGRRWHWQGQGQGQGQISDRPLAVLRAGLGTATLWVLRFQVAIVYLNAAAAKWGVTEWADGTALYYWFVDPSFGFTKPLKHMLGFIIENPLTLTLLTWGVIAFEFSLFAGLFMDKRLPRQILLGIGIAFHTGISFVHGLPSFATIMFGALILLLRREDEPFTFIQRARWSEIIKRAQRLASERRFLQAPVPGNRV